MRTLSTAAALAAAVLLAANALCQRGGSNRWRQPEEITNRVGLFFTTTPGPTTDGDKVADLATVELVRQAVAARQLTVLYLFDGGADERTRQNFEWQLGRDAELGIQLRCFHCGRIDLAKDAALAARYGEDAPLFVVFDEHGKASTVSMAGHKPAANKLKKALEKAAGGAMKPPLPTFAKKYGKLVRELSGVLARQAATNEKLAKAGDDKSKRKKAEKELQKLADEQAELLEQERELLADLRLPARGAERIGQRPRRDRDERGGRNGR